MSSSRLSFHSIRFTSRLIVQNHYNELTFFVYHIVFAHINLILIASQTHHSSIALAAFQILCNYAGYIAIFSCTAVGQEQGCSGQGQEQGRGCSGQGQGRGCTEPGRQ